MKAYFVGIRSLEECSKKIWPEEINKSIGKRSRGEWGSNSGGIILWRPGPTNVIKCSLGTEVLSLNVFLVSFCPAFSSLLLPFNICFAIVVLFCNNYHDLAFDMRANRILV